MLVAKKVWKPGMEGHGHPEGCAVEGGLTEEVGLGMNSEGWQGEIRDPMS